MGVSEHDLETPCGTGSDNPEWVLADVVCMTTSVASVFVGTCAGSTSLEAWEQRKVKGQRLDQYEH